MTTDAASHLYVLGHVEVPIKATSSGYITKRGRIPVYGDNPAWYPPIVALALNPEMVEWLISELEFAQRGASEDGMLTDLKRLRDEMKEGLWAATAA